MAVAKELQRWKWVCKVCGKEIYDVTRRSNLTPRDTLPDGSKPRALQHMLIHAKEIPLPGGVCPVCGKKGRSEYHAWMHLAQAHPDVALETMVKNGIPAPEAVPITVPREDFYAWAEDILRKAESEKGTEEADTTKTVSPKVARGTSRRAKKKEVEVVVAGKDPEADTGPAREGEEEVMAEEEVTALPVRQDGEAAGPVPEREEDKEFSSESMLRHLRTARFASAHADEEEVPEGEEEEPEEEVYQPWARSRGGDEDAEIEGELEEVARPRVRREGAIGRGGKMAIVAVLGLAVAGAALYGWRKLRSNARSTRLPVGNVLQTGTGSPTATKAATQETAAGSTAASAQDNPLAGAQGIVMIDGRGAVGKEYADRKHLFL